MIRCHSAPNILDNHGNPVKIHPNHGYQKNKTHKNNKRVNAFVCGSTSAHARHSLCLRANPRFILGEQAGALLFSPNFSRTRSSCSGCKRVRLAIVCVHTRLPYMSS